MDRLYRVLVCAGIVISLACIGSSFQCEKENFWGRTEYFNCPQPGDNSDEIYCCGGDNKYCCSFRPNEFLEDTLNDIFGDDGDDIHEIAKNILPVVLGVIGAAVLLLVCLICCCCWCPFCLLYKRKHRGTVHNPNPEVSVMQPLQNQPQPHYPPPQQAPYPMQQQPPAGYPPQPYPPQPYPPQPYPTDAPPQYTEKQPPAYNPTY